MSRGDRVKLKILKVFKDKDTDVLYKKNNIIDVSTKRAKELLGNENNLVEKVNDMEVKDD